LVTPPQAAAIKIMAGMVGNSSARSNKNNGKWHNGKMAERQNVCQNGRMAGQKNIRTTELMNE